jgi:ABC-type glycerol-3-phosphate transport system permease component
MRRRSFVSLMFGLAFAIWIIFPPLFLMITSLRTYETIESGGVIAFLLENVHYTFDQAIVLWGVGAGLGVLFLMAMALFSVGLPREYSRKLKEKTKERRAKK